MNEGVLKQLRFFLQKRYLINIMAARNEPRYTIEQIELLRRLMRTGLTKMDIIHALDTMTKLDAELSGSSSPPVVDQQQQQQQPKSIQQQLQQQQQLHQQQQQQTIHTVHSSQTTAQQNASNRQHPEVCQQQFDPMPAVNQLMNAVQQVTGVRQQPQQQQLHIQQQQQRVTPIGIVRNVVAGQQPGDEVKCGFENFDVSDEEVHELFRRGIPPVKEEIQAFITKHHITQNQISQATGISQSYISQFLLHGLIMRESTQTLFYKWYLGKMKEMDLLEKELGASIESSRQRDVYPGKNAHLIPPIRKRMRFSWNETCLKVLESYWKKNPYPNDVEREKITEACNTSQQTAAEVDWSADRIVTPGKVYNWFANRRKDANRRKRLSVEVSGTETNTVTLEESEGEIDSSSSSQQPHVLHHIQEVVHLQESTPHMEAVQVQDNKYATTTVDIQQHDHQHQQHHHQQQHETVAVELDEVNSSIITLMQAVEEKNQADVGKS